MNVNDWASWGCMVAGVVLLGVAVFDERRDRYQRWRFWACVLYGAALMGLALGLLI